MDDYYYKKYKKYKNLYKNLKGGSRSWFGNKGNDEDREITSLNEKIYYTYPYTSGNKYDRGGVSADVKPILLDYIQKKKLRWTSTHLHFKYYPVTSFDLLLLNITEYIDDPGLRLVFTSNSRRKKQYYFRLKEEWEDDGKTVIKFNLIRT